MAGVKGQKSGGQNRRAPALHMLRGTFQPSRHGRPMPEAPGGLPEPPPGLPAAVLAHWRVTVGLLDALGVVSRVDGLIVEQYSRLFVETAQVAVTQTETAASIARLEENLSGLEGAELVQCFQEITKLRQLEARYTGQIRQGRMAQRQYLIELCLTPASRARGVSRPAATTTPVDRKKQRYLDALEQPSA